ncbi:MAG: hypothetical protein JSV03_01730 [Planctomycetota bacterium]|nr:MAG: hypothetical protein JSV03_01730 [Planctomycetota bacterium]
MTAIPSAVTGLCMKKRWWQRWRWMVTALASAALLWLGTCWMMFQHIPSWYQPILVPPDDLQKVKDDLVATFDQLSEKMVKQNQPFDCRFTQDQINSWLAILEQIWPPSRDWLPPSLSDPFVSIDPKGIRLAATYRKEMLKTVIGARLEVGVTATGIMLRLTAVSGGMLSTPKSWIKEKLAALDQSVWPAGKQLKSQYGQDKLPNLSDLADGILLPNAWIWQNGKQPFKITNLQLDPGSILITFEPLPRH